MWKTLTQKYEAIFLALTDSAPKEFLEIQTWLHNEAAQYGYFIDPANSTYRGCIDYQKGSKKWMMVAARTPHFELYHLPEGDYHTAIKVEFRNAIKNYPEQVNSLVQKYPNLFLHKQNNCGTCKPDCEFRYHFEEGGQKHDRCGYGYFYWWNPTLDVVRDILEVYKLANKIKPLK